MIVFLGKRVQILKMYEDSFSKCEFCDHKPVNYIVKQKYFHLYYIPVFPITKQVDKYCEKCTMLSENIFGEMPTEYYNQTKTPFYMYSWIIIGFILIISVNLI